MSSQQAVKSLCLERFILRENDYISEEDVKKILFLARESWQHDRRPEIRNFTDLVEALQDVGLLSGYNIVVLQILLKNIDRDDVADRLGSFCMEGGYVYLTAEENNTVHIIAKDVNLTEEEMSLLLQTCKQWMDPGIQIVLETNDCNGIWPEDARGNALDQPSSYKCIASEKVKVLKKEICSLLERNCGLQERSDSLQEKSDRLESELVCEKNKNTLLEHEKAVLLDEQKRRECNVPKENQKRMLSVEICEKFQRSKVTRVFPSTCHGEKCECMDNNMQMAHNEQIAYDMRTKLHRVIRKNRP